MSSAKDTHVPLALGEELNIYTASAVHQQVREAVAAGTDLALDLGAVSDIDSAGVQQLLLLERECRAAGHALAVTAASDPVREVLGLLHLERLLPATAAQA